MFTLWVIVSLKESLDKYSTAEVFFTHFLAPLAGFLSASERTIPSSSSSTFYLCSREQKH